MYRAVIVDDDENVREVLRLMLPWETYGFTVVGEAGNGAEALKLMPAWRPDFVLTDDRMPILNGLEYIRKLKEQFPRAIVAVLSAYGEFRAAQEAFRLGVFDYLMKPIWPESMGNLLARVRLALDEDSRRQLNERRQMELIREKWLHDLCRGRWVDPEDTGRFFAAGEESVYQVILAEMNDFQRYAAENPEREPDLRRFAMRNGVMEAGQAVGIYEVYEDAPGRIGVLIGWRPSRFQRDAEVRLCRAIRESLERSLGIPVSLGVGRPCGEWRDIRKSRDEALVALESVIFSGGKGVLRFEDVEARKRFGHGPSSRSGASSSAAADVAFAKRLGAAVDEGDGKAARAALDHFFRQWKHGSDPESFRALCLEAVIELAQLIKSRNGDIRLVFGERLEEYGTVYRIRSHADLQRWMTGLSVRTMDCLRELEAMRHPGAMDVVKALIDRRYDEDISLKKLAVDVHMNPVYLGQLFKHTYGESFSHYLTRVRIDKAKELLRREPLRVYEIAEKVGYVNLDTFYQRFRQMTGMNPTEYKQQERQKRKIGHA